MSQSIRIRMVQMDAVVGAVEANAAFIKAEILSQQDQHDCIVFPELALTGYPPEDLLFKPELYVRVEKALKEIQAITQDCVVIVGHPAMEDAGIYNRADVFYQQQNIARHDKYALPNYGVFDEQRYFTPGPDMPCILSIKGQRFGLCICEDFWDGRVVASKLAHGIDHLICINASPFAQGKFAERYRIARAYAEKGISVLYLNMVGGQDELVFDGRSFVVNQSGKIVVKMPAFAVEANTVTIDSGQPLEGTVETMEPIALLYKALVCATRDYVNKNGFPGVLVGLSGGIDSALTLAIAVDALGAENVHAVMMPSKYTADISRIDANAQLERLEIASTTIDIEPMMRSYSHALCDPFQGYAADITEENLQARIRGTLLMALSNKWGHMVLTTSNKSEVAVGYSTLYGDMVGGFSVLQDVLKTEVYALARWRNRQSSVIPERVLSRAPSAELADNQCDQDSLPDYAILDEMIRAILEQNMGIADLIRQGSTPELATQVYRLIQRSEYKRRQAPPGPKVSARAFGKDWRQPITNAMLI